MAWAEQKASGRWVGRYRDANGRPRTAPGGPFISKAKALSAAEDQDDLIRRGSWTDPRACERPFADYFEHWINVRAKERQLEVRTVANYWDRYRTGLKPTFGHVPVAHINRLMVRAWMTDMEAEGVGSSTIRARFSLLHSVMNARLGVSAVSDGLRDDDPCRGIVPPKAPDRKPTAYTPDQVDALIGALDPWWRLMVLFDSETGFRWGELTGVRVRDVGFLQRRVTATQTIIEPGKKWTGNDTRFLLKGWPKNGEPRTVGLTPETADLLSAHVAARGLGPDDLLFPMPMLKRNGKTGHYELVPEVMRTDVWSQGLPVSRHYFRKAWAAAITEAGVPYRRRHDLRASFITWLTDSDLSHQQIMELAGHRNWATTRRYVASLDHTQEAGVAAIANIRSRFRTNARETG